ncbi:hypothetical protein [Abyssibacter profundi]|uniref:Secreted protein n=1 Tax=Abyssibacter profundi TaxID=2182787 RepID=A0A383XPZ5_9GAMM|nr:hypothetical protein [Abyssibacter profundi]MBV62018.1 hypothetical protein [Nevskiales bacterium]PWN54699.1 hypothetical protein DEH80_15875 [Abyssibacter profundi]
MKNITFATLLLVSTGALAHGNHGFDDYVPIVPAPAVEEDTTDCEPTTRDEAGQRPGADRASSDAGKNATDPGGEAGNSPSAASKPAKPCRQNPQTMPGEPNEPESSS